MLAGSSSGIGQGTAIHFASLGCRVVVTGRNPDRLHQTADLCIKAGAKPEHVSIEIFCVKFFLCYQNLSIILPNKMNCEMVH